MPPIRRYHRAGIAPRPGRPARDRKNFALGLTSGLAYLITSSCIAFNPGFIEENRKSNSSKEPATSPHLTTHGEDPSDDEASGPTNTTSVTPVKPGDESTGLSTQSPSESTTTSSAASSTVSDSTSSLSTGTDSTSTSASDTTSLSTATGSPTSTESLAGSNSSSSSSGFDKKGPEGVAGADQGRWFPIDITNSNPQASLPAGYSVSIRVDHQQLLREGGRTDGRDFGLVAVENNGYKVLDRVLDPESNWNRNDSQFWFATDLSIPPNSTLSGRYYMVLGHPDITSKLARDPKKVFLVYDDFSASSVDSSIWRVQHSAFGISGAIPSNSEGQVALYAEPSGRQDVYYSLSLRYPASTQGVAFESRSRTPESTTNGRCDRNRPLTAHKASDRQTLAALQQHQAQFRFFTQSAGNASETQTVLGAEHQADNNWHRMKMTWSGSQFHLFRDQNQLHAYSHPESFSGPAQNWDFGFAAIAHPLNCNHTIQVRLQVDWALLRRFTSPEPSTQIRTR